MRRTLSSRREIYNLVSHAQTFEYVPLNEHVEAWGNRGKL
jgi:hypothetical protein